MITINKINNSTPVLTTSLTERGFDLSLSASATDDLDGKGSFSYQWQQRNINMDWQNISDATNTTYTVPSTNPGSIRYRVEVTYTDAQGNVVRDYVTTSADYRVNVDDNNDGLIDVYYLEDLDDMRYWFSGTPATCGETACIGFGLRRSLNFREAASYREGIIKNEWITGRGWAPIGDINNPFPAVFGATADNFSIINLYIDRPDEDNVGLFGSIGATARISDIHLESVSVIGRFTVGALTGLSNRLTASDASVTSSSLIVNSSADGNVIATDDWVGGLVGSNYGSIINCYASGNVNGQFAAGGLVGYSFGPISNSYAHSDVIGKVAVGGLVGYNHDEIPFKGGGFITNSYAGSSVEGAFDVGGLLGNNDAGVITNVYATGDVIGSMNVGGLLGHNSTGTVINGYADGNVAGGDNVGDLVGNNAGGEFTELNSKVTLNYERGTDSNGYPICDTLQMQDGYSVQLPDCGTPLPEQDRDGSSNLALSALTLSAGTLEPSFDPTKTYYEILDIPDGVSNTTVTAMVNNSSASLIVNSQASPRSIPLADIGATAEAGINIVLTAMNQSTKHYTIVRLAQPDLSDAPLSPCSTTDIDKDNDGLIEICDIEGLYAIRYQSGELPMTCGGNNDESCMGYELERDIDFNVNTDYRTSTTKTNRNIWSEGRGWRPIGNFRNPFDAVFNANGYAIANLRINRPDSDYIGLFGYTTDNARLIDIELAGAQVHGRYLVGALGGRNNAGTIIGARTSSITTTTTVIGNGLWIGGLVGESTGFINNSHASGVVSGNKMVGGLVGVSAARITNSHAENEVAGRNFTGNLIGLNAGVIANSYTTGVVREANFYYAGGLVGLNLGTIMNSYANGGVNGNERVGGLVGDNRNLVEDSYAISTVSGTRLVGALVGVNSGTITNSYASAGDAMLVDSNLGVGEITNSRLLNIAMLQSPIAGWSMADWDFGSESQYPALKYTSSEGDTPECSQCDLLLSGQYLELISLTASAPATLLKSGEFNYILTVNMGAVTVELTPVVSNSSITISYRVDNATLQTAQNATPFSLELPEVADTITIKLSAPTNIPNFASIRSPDYTINIKRRAFTQIKIFLEGLLQE